ncbi:MAG: hypothetical protein ACJ72B_16165 [Ornithinibacter sp.]
MNAVGRPGHGSLRADAGLSGADAGSRFARVAGLAHTDHHGAGSGSQMSASRDPVLTSTNWSISARAVAVAEVTYWSIWARACRDPVLTSTNWSIWARAVAGPVSLE